MNYKNLFKQCPYCHRTFNLRAADGHIEVCQNSRYRAKPPPSAEVIQRKHSERKLALLKSTGNKVLNKS